MKLTSDVGAHPVKVMVSDAHSRGVEGVGNVAGGGGAPVQQLQVLQ